jgi:hypothetical protein
MKSHPEAITIFCFGKHHKPSLSLYIYIYIYIERERLCCFVKHKTSRASCPYLKFENPNSRSKPLNMIFVLKYLWRSNFIFCRSNDLISKDISIRSCLTGWINCLYFQIRDTYAKHGRFYVSRSTRDFMFREVP